MSEAQIKQKKPSSYEKAINELLLAAPKITAYYIKNPFDDSVDPYTRRIGTYIIDKSSTMLSALVQVAGTVDDMRTVVSMLGKYPWDERRISRAKHLELSWFLFQNLCYKFKEKLKLAFNCQKQICRPLGFEEVNWLRFELKNVERTLGGHIQDRGNTVHNWNVQHRDIDFLSMVELMRSFRQSGQELDLPEGFFDIIGHYRDARYFLKDSAKAALVDAESCLERVLTKHDPEPKQIVRKSHDIIDKILQGGVVLRPEM